jgi:hypothetical protein
MATQRRRECIRKCSVIISELIKGEKDKDKTNNKDITGLSLVHGCALLLLLLLTIVFILTDDRRCACVNSASLW